MSWYVVNTIRRHFSYSTIFIFKKLKKYALRTWSLWPHVRNARVCSFEDENSLPAEMSSDCVNYMSGHIDTKYLDQAFWFHGWMTACQRPKSVTSATMESPSWSLSTRGSIVTTLFRRLLSMSSSIASEHRETESCPEASSHGYWIHQLDTRKTAHVNFTYVWPTLLRKLNHKYESFCANIMNISCFSHHIASYQLENVLMKTYDCHHSRARCPLRTVSTMSSTNWEIKCTANGSAR